MMCSARPPKIWGLKLPPQPAPSTKEIPYSDFKQKVGRGEVAQITIKGNQISGKFKLENSGNEHKQPENRISFFQTFQGSQTH